MFNKYKVVGTVEDKWLWLLHLFVDIFVGILSLYLGKVRIVNASLYFSCFIFDVCNYFFMSVLMFGY